MKTTTAHIPIRVTRGGIAAAVGVILGLVGHSLLFGSFGLSAGALAVAVVIGVLSVGIGWAMAAEQRSWMFIAAFVFLLQISVHLGATVTPHLEQLLVSQPASLPMHNHAEMQQSSVGAGAGAEGTVGATVWMAMLAAHALAAGLAALILTRGEMWVWRRASRMVKRVWVLIGRVNAHRYLEARRQSCHAVRWQLPLTMPCADAARSVPHRGPPSVGETTAYWRRPRQCTCLGASAHTS